MSCFGGSFHSLPGVRCDRFDCLEDDSSVPAQHLFLSHCHADHMVRQQHLLHNFEGGLNFLLNLFLCSGGFGGCWYFFKEEEEKSSRTKEAVLLHDLQCLCTEEVS